MKNHRQSRPWVGGKPAMCNYTLLNRTDWDELMPCMTPDDDVITHCKCVHRTLKQWNGTFHPVHRRIMYTDMEPVVESAASATTMLINNLFLPSSEASFGVFGLDDATQKELSSSRKYVKGQGYQPTKVSIFDDYTTIDQGCRGTCSKSNPIVFKVRAFPPPVAHW